MKAQLTVIWSVALILVITHTNLGDEKTPERHPNSRPIIGLWYTVWWTKDDQFKHWINCQRFPTRGHYTSGDPSVISDHYKQFRDLGIDFLIMDDTNGVGADSGKINDHIRAWFDFMDRRPEKEIIPICIGGGGEMRAEGRAGQQRASDIYHRLWAQRTSYFQLEGKPLLLVDTDHNYGPGDFDDKRFTVRWVYNGNNYEFMARRQTWGWGAYEPVPILKECMSIWPGHRFPKYVAEQGKDPLEQAREGGRLYVRMWLRVLKAKPQYVTIADWNNFEEDTAIEDSYQWEDRFGFAVPDLYRRITRAYSRLRNGEFVKGEYYQDENKPDIYLFDGRRLIPLKAEPNRCAIIIVPTGTLDCMMTGRTESP